MNPIDKVFAYSRQFLSNSCNAFNPSLRRMRVFLSFGFAPGFSPPFIAVFRGKTPVSGLESACSDNV
jgi:hypothetical protein